MALGILGGMLLASAGQYGFDQYYRGQQQEQKGILSAQLDQARQGLLASPRDPAAIANYRNAAMTSGMDTAEINSRIEQYGLQAPDPLSTKDRFSMTQDLANQRTAMLKPFIEQRKAAEKTMTALAQRTGAGDLAAVISFNKSLDPSSVVRESEQKAVTGVAGPIERFRALVQDVEGKGKLTDPTRAQLASLIEEIQANEVKYANSIVSDYERRAQSYEIDPLDIRGGQLGYSPQGKPLSTFSPVRAPQTILDDAARARMELRRRGKL